MCSLFILANIYIFVSVYIYIHTCSIAAFALCIYRKINVWACVSKPPYKLHWKATTNERVMQIHKHTHSNNNNVTLTYIFTNCVLLSIRLLDASILRAYLYYIGTTSQSLYCIRTHLISIGLYCEIFFFIFQCVEIAQLFASANVLLGWIKNSVCVCMSVRRMNLGRLVWINMYTDWKISNDASF